MAERRMFAKTIIDSDVFLDMPLSSQSLYFHLSMRADDEGFINNPKKIQRMIGCSEDDLRLLMAKKFILVFDSGVIVIKHWKIHNYIRKDRAKGTVYQDERNELAIKENGAYTLDDGKKDECQAYDNQLTTDRQHRLGEDRLGKDSIGEYRLAEVKETAADVNNYYEKNGFGAITYKTIQDFEDWISDFIKVGATLEDAKDIVIHSLDIAIDNNVRKYSYANAILQDWENKQYKSVDQIEAEDKRSKSNARNRLENSGSSEYDDLF